MKAKDKVSLDLAGKSVLIQNLAIDNQDVFNFLEDKKDKEEVVRKALILGIIGLKSMGIETRVDYIDKRFHEFMIEVEKKFAEQHASVEKLIKETFDETDTKSPMFKFTKSLETYFDDDNGVVRNLIKDTFDVENSKGPMGILADNLNTYFNKGGTLSELLDKHFDLGTNTSSMSLFVDKLAENFDVDKGTIKILLDPTKEKSPLYILRQEINDKLDQLKTDVALKKLEKEMKAKSASKGFEFEKDVFEMLQEIANNYTGDHVDDVSKIRGPLGDVGDFVVSTPDGNIVVEAKDENRGNSGAPETIREIKAAMENRKAKFGIFLFNELGQMPSRLNPIKIDKNYVITSSEGNGLYYAYRLAKIFVESERKTTDTVQVEKIQEEAENIRKKSLAIDDAIQKTNLIKGHANTIEITLVSLQKEINEGLNTIQRLARN